VGGKNGGALWHRLAGTGAGGGGSLALYRLSVAKNEWQAFETLTLFSPVSTWIKN
jgi:hypothetical protein